MKILSHQIILYIGVIFYSILVGTMQNIYAQEPTLDWGRLMGGSKEDVAWGIAVDLKGNVYTTGSYEAFADFDPDTGIFNLSGVVASRNAFISKINASGDFVWAKGFGGGDDDYGFAVEIDLSGNVYSVGSFQGSVDFDPGVGTFYVTSSGSTDVYILKLDSAGNFLWVKTLGDIGTDRAFTIALDDSGNVYTAGEFRWTVDFDPGVGTTNLTSAGNSDIFVSKLDSNGDFVWVRQLGGTGTEKVSSIIVDPAGNLVLACQFQHTADFDPGVGVHIFNPVGFKDIAIVKLNSSGDFILASHIGGPASDYCRTVAADLSGNIYAVGTFGSTMDFDPGIDTFNIDATSGTNMYILKLDALGGLVWASAFGGPNGLDYVESIAVDYLGNIYLTGLFSDTVDFDPGPDTFDLIANNGDAFVSKLDSSGKFIWATNLEGPGMTWGLDITVDGWGNVYSAGRGWSTIDFEPGPGTSNLVSAGEEDVYIQKLNQKGVVGYVYNDISQDCVWDVNELGLISRRLTIQPGNIIVQTSKAGYWGLDSLPIGTYTVTIDTSGEWSTTCPVSQNFTIIDPSKQTNAPYFGFISTNPCSSPEVSINAPFLRPCFSNQNVYIQACNLNIATGALYNAYVEVTLDSLLSVQSTTLPYTIIGSNTYRFELGDLYPDQCVNFSVACSLSCNAVLSQTLCMQADLYPADSCVFNTVLDTTATGVSPCTNPWDNSSLQVDGDCINDTIRFVVTNTGDPGSGDMICYAPIRVYIDGGFILLDSVQLVGGDSAVFSFSGDGRTWRLEADQHPLHPGNSHPNATIELCGDTSNWTSGLVNILPMNDGDPITDIYCGLVTGSYDPNDKRGYPIGIPDSNTIMPNQQLQYSIRFQNTGTDTAFRVVVRDTLDTNLNIFSVVSGVSSHSYEFTMYGPRVLEWTFDNILLPDSNINEPESHGFLTFTVDQIPNLSHGTDIQNSADIYFDFNAPIITNQAVHKIDTQLKTPQFAGTMTINDTACGPYLLNGFTYSTSGTYIQSIEDSNGMDSIIVLNIFSNNTSKTITESNCNSYMSPSGNYTYTTSGTYTDTIPNTLGCDSLITIDLTINNGSTNTMASTVCNSYLSPSGNYTYTASGTYTDTISNTIGCDSIITLNLTVNSSSSSSISPIGCNSYISPSGNYTYISSGIYSDTISNTDGCDSVINISLTITQPSATISGLDTIYCSTDVGITMIGSPAGGVFSGTGAVAGTEFYPATGVGTYIITYAFTDSSGCSSVVSQSVNVIKCPINIGIEEQRVPDIKIYPNPNTGKFDIEFTLEDSRSFDLKIYNNLGQEVVTEHEENFQGTYKKHLELMDYPVGLYHLRFRVGDVLIERKIVIE